MSKILYANEDNIKKESIDNYKDLLLEYKDSPPSLRDDLLQMNI